MPKGIVEAVSKKEVKTKFGMKPTFSLKVDGEWYSNGFTDPRVGMGDEIAFEFTDGRYGKEFDKGSIMRVSKADPSTAAPAPAAAPKSTGSLGGMANGRVFPIPPLHGDRAIVRQNALGHASRLMAGYIKPGSSYDEELLTNTVIRVARKFEAYACGDLDLARAKELKVSAALTEEQTTQE